MTRKLTIGLALLALTTVAYAQPVPEPTPSEPAGEPEPGGDPEPGTDPDPIGDPQPIAPPVDPGSTVPSEVRLRRLEQRVQELKERAWRAKATVAMLKEQMVGGGVGAQLNLSHKNDMGSSFRLIRLAYAMDGTQIFSRTEKTSPGLYKVKKFDILTGPIGPGAHTVNVIATYRGHGYGVFKHLEKFTFRVRSSHTFTAVEGQTTDVEAVAFEKGGRTKKMEERPAFRFKVSTGDKDSKDSSESKGE